MIAALEIFAEHDLEQHCGFEHPRHWRPEFFQRHPQRVCARIRHRVRAEFLQPPARRVAGQTDWQLNVVFRLRR